MLAETFSDLDFNSEVFEMFLNRYGWSQRKIVKTHDNFLC